MKTNRDLYKAIEALLEEKKEGAPPALEVYLGNLRDRAWGFSDKRAITMDQFFSLLRDSFEESGPAPATSSPDRNQKLEISIGSSPHLMLTLPAEPRTA